jgi:hypothetical protein
MPDGDFFWNAWRTYTAHVLLDRGGKLRKSRLEDPTQMQRFLVGSQDTSHLEIIPVLEYSSKYLIKYLI